MLILYLSNGDLVYICAWNYNYDELLGMLKGGEPPHYGEFRIKQGYRLDKVYTIPYREDVTKDLIIEMVKWLKSNTPGAREAQGRYMFENGKYVHPERNPRSEACPEWYGGSFAN